MMMIRSRRTLFALLLALTARAEDDEQCGVYLALSSTSTVVKTTWGVYAGTDIEKGGIVGNNDLAIHTFHLRANNLLGSGASDAEQDLLLGPLEYLEESFWVADPTGGRYELERGRIISAVQGVGALGAFDVKLTNADWNHKAAYYKPLIGETTGDPHASRGAISPAYNVELRANDAIKAGSEIFINYGSNWEDEELKDELVKPDYEKIDETVEQMISFFKKHGEKLDEDAKIEIYQFITKDVMNAAVGPKKARKVAALLPTHPDGLPAVSMAGGSLLYSQPTVRRSLEWLQQHGRCMDHIEVGASTVKNAGRGAFAKRPIKAGNLVSPMPLIQIPESKVLDLHAVVMTDSKEGTFVRESDFVTGQQLLLNYCLGHKESSMLLFPTGSAAGFINHADEPNAKLVWSNHASHESSWLQMDPEELLSDDENRYLGLLMEVVALRDIAAGEEVFIDYGPEWKAAWEAHVTSWQERLASGDLPNPWPLRAVDLNEEYRSKPFKTLLETKKDPYPKNVGLGAFLMLQESKGETGEASDPKIWTTPKEGTQWLAEHLFEPVIVDRHLLEEGDDDEIQPYNYTVRWTNSQGEHTYVKDVPHSAFVFIDEPETSDQFTEQPFRHWIGIPDEIFPQGPWRNMA